MLVCRITPAEKQILITNAVGVIHEKLCKSNAFMSHFHAIGMWLPINHLVHDESGNVNSNIPAPEEEMQVSIQHFKEYNYSEMVTPVVIHGAIDKDVLIRLLLMWRSTVYRPNESNTMLLSYLI